MFCGKWYHCPFLGRPMVPSLTCSSLPKFVPSSFKHFGLSLDIMHALDLTSVLNIPLTPEAYDELAELQDQIGTVNYDVVSQDKWTFMWGNDKYSRKLYAMAFSSLPVPVTFSWVWKSQCTPRIKVFMWLTLVDRLNTRVMLRRHNFNIQSGVNCVLCNSGNEEGITHLLFEYLFAARCWLKLQIRWDLILDIH